MAQDIAIGSKVNIKVVKAPSNEAARKTIVRVLSKDPEVKKDNERLRRAREAHLRWSQRGGRQWADRVVKQHPLEAQVGESGTVLATNDVLTDLRSVARFVEVTPA
jgi:hypothetical protein